MTFVACDYINACVVLFAEIFDLYDSDDCAEDSDDSVEDSDDSVEDSDDCLVPTHKHQQKRLSNSRSALDYRHRKRSVVPQSLSHFIRDSVPTSSFWRCWYIDVQFITPPLPALFVKFVSAIFPVLQTITGTELYVVSC